MLSVIVRTDSGDRTHLKKRTIKKQMWRPRKNKMKKNKIKMTVLTILTSFLSLTVFGQTTAKQTVDKDKIIGTFTYDGQCPQGCLTTYIFKQNGTVETTIESSKHTDKQSVNWSINENSKVIKIDKVNWNYKFNSNGLILTNSQNPNETETLIRLGKPAQIQSSDNTISLDNLIGTWMPDHPATDGTTDEEIRITKGNNGKEFKVESFLFQETYPATIVANSIKYISYGADIQHRYEEQAVLLQPKNNDKLLMTNVSDFITC